MTKTPIPNGMRIAFVGQVGSTNEIRTQDVRWTGAVSKPIVRMDPPVARNAKGICGFLPSCGQFQKGQTGRGILYLGLTLVGAAGATGAYLRGESNREDTDAAELAYTSGVAGYVENQETWGPARSQILHEDDQELEDLYIEWQEAYDESDPLRNVFIGAVSVAATAWLVSVIDGQLGKGKSGKPRERSVEVSSNKVNFQQPYPQIFFADGKIRYGIGMTIKF